MSSPDTAGPLFRPFERLIRIEVMGRECEVPENNMMLRGFQYLASQNIAYGRFCWNEECQYCRVTYDMGAGTPSHEALSCKLMVREGMRVTAIAAEIRYCLRDLRLAKEKK